MCIKRQFGFLVSALWLTKRALVFVCTAMCVESQGGQAGQGAQGSQEGQEGQGGQEGEEAKKANEAKKAKDAKRATNLQGEKRITLLKVPWIEGSSG